MLNLLYKYKKTIKIISFIAIILGLTLVFLSFRQNTEEENTTDKINPEVNLLNASELRQSEFGIEATGEVKSLGQVDLKSEVSAKIKRVNVDLGDDIFAGQSLVIFENSDLAARLLQAEAGVDAAKAQLAQLKSGAKQEEINSAKTNLENTKRSLEAAQLNLENTHNKAQQDLENAHNNALNILRNSSESAKQSLVALSNIQYNHFQNNSMTSLTIQSAKALAMNGLFDVSGAGNWTGYYVNDRDSGIYKRIKDLSSDEFGEIGDYLDQMKQVFRSTQEAFNLLPLNKLTIAEESIVSTQKNTITSQINAISSAKQTIKSQKVVNQNLISNAENALVNTENAVKSAKNQLDLVKSGATGNQIAAQEAQVKSALANLYQVRSQFNKTVIKSPISGKISEISVNLGELVSMGRLVCSVVNDEALEIKTYLNSEEALLVEKGDKVEIQGNANGAVNRIAPSINPNSKKVEVQILLEKQESSNLIVGQFVNLRILTDEVSEAGTFLIPLSAVRNKPSNKAVVMILENNKVFEKNVELGDIKGERVEIISGLNSGDKLVESLKGLENGEEVRVGK